MTGENGAGAKGKRYPLSLRTTREIREKLEAAADQSGRSLAQEIELRIERSIAHDEALGGAHVATLARMVAANVSLIETFLGARWDEDDDVRATCAKAIGEMLRMYVRTTDPVGVERAARLRAESVGSNIASIVADNPTAKDIGTMVGAYDALIARMKVAEVDGRAKDPMGRPEARLGIFRAVQRMLDEPDRTQSYNDLRVEVGYVPIQDPEGDEPMDAAHRRAILEEYDRHLRSELDLPPRSA